MSRLARKPLTLPQGVTLALSDGKITVTGSKGTLVFPLHPLVRVHQSEGGVAVSVGRPEKAEQRALLGLTVRLIANAALGVSQGFERAIEVQGIGYKMNVEGKEVVFDIGFSHQVRMVLPEGLTATVEKNVLTLKGIDKQLVGETAARYRLLRPPEPYKGKGIRYVGEVVKKKAGKAAKAAGAKA